jgi:16S rRNA (uracil1498-N3)-methyltransferase
MRTFRAHVPELCSGEQRLPPSVSHHLLRVLRLGVGASVTLFDGAGREGVARLERIEGDVLWARVEGVVEALPQPPVQVHLAVSLLKSDKLSDVVRMGTELGVVSFQPLVSARCDVKELSASKATRLARIAAEAARQSGRTQIPVIHPPLALGDDWKPVGELWVAHPGGREAFGAVPFAAEVTMATGPEGGWSPQEVERLVARGARTVRLTKSILRAETAPIAMAAALLLMAGH